MKRSWLHGAVGVTGLAVICALGACSDGNASAATEDAGGSQAATSPSNHEGNESGTTPADPDVASSAPTDNPAPTNQPGKKKPAEDGSHGSKHAGDTGGNGTADSKPAGGNAPTPNPVPSNPKNQKVVLARIPGKSASTCVAVGSRKDVRSGRIAMGNFVTARKQYKAQTKNDKPVVDLYVIPQSRSMKGVSVKMTPVSGGVQPSTVRSNEVKVADVWKYYSVHLEVPSSGTWKLQVSSGDDSGCFEVDFSR